MSDCHSMDIVDGRLNISYEKRNEWQDGKGETGVDPELAVLLVTRCCEINHDHIEISKMEAVKLAHWLHRFITGEFDE